MGVHMTLMNAQTIFILMLIDNVNLYSYEQVENYECISSYYGENQSNNDDRNPINMIKYITRFYIFGFEENFMGKYVTHYHCLIVIKT